MKLNGMSFIATFNKEIIEQPSAGEYRFYDKHNNEKVFDFLASSMVISDSRHDVTFDVWGLDEDVTDEDIAEALLSDNYKWEEFLYIPVKVKTLQTLLKFRISHYSLVTNVRALSFALKIR